MFGPRAEAELADAARWYGRAHNDRRGQLVAGWQVVVGAFSGHQTPEAVEAAFERLNRASVPGLGTLNAHALATAHALRGALSESTRQGFKI